MVLRVTSLDDDALRCTARFVAKNGDGYWFARSCRSFSIALRAVMKDDGVVFKTHLSTCFLTPAILRFSILDLQLRKLITGNPDAYNYGALMRTSHGMHWAPHSVRLAYRVAPIELIDYMTPCWKLNVDRKALPYVAAAGRVNMLDEMLGETRSGLAAELQTFATASSMVDPYFYEANLILPAIKAGEVKAMQWLFNRLGEIAPDGEWRDKMCNSCTRSIGALATSMLSAAVESAHAAVMLGYIIGSLIPKAARVTGNVYLDLRMSLLAITLAVLAGNGNGNVDAWSWLKQQGYSAFSLWSTLNNSREMFRPTRRIDARRVLSQLICTGSGDVYKWQRNEITNESDWLYEIFHSELYGLPRVRPLEYWRSRGVSPRAAFAFSTLASATSTACLQAAYVDTVLHLHENWGVDIEIALPSNELVQRFDAVEGIFSRMGDIPSKHRGDVLRWLQERELPRMALALVLSKDHVRLRRCLTARSEGGYGASGASMHRAAKEAISHELVETPHRRDLMALLEGAGMYANPLSRKDKDSPYYLE